MSSRQNWRVLAWIVVVSGVVCFGHTGLSRAADAPSDAGGRKTRVTIDVKDTELSRVLDAFSQQTGLSVVVGKEVAGQVTVRLTDVEWDRALDAILKPYGFGYERAGDVLIIMPLAKLKELNDAQPVGSRVFKLLFIDAGDIKPVVESQLSPHGKVQVLEEAGQKGWEFGSFGTAGSAGSANRGGVGAAGGTSAGRYQGGQEKRAKSKRLVVTDIPAVLDRITTIVASLDIKPQQVLIEARFMEVSRDRLKDLGVDFATGSSGTSTGTIQTTPTDKNGNGDAITAIGGHVLGALAAPAAFGARSSDITKTTPFNTGLSLAFRKLTGTQFDILVHALEEDVHTNTLSAPSIMTLDNQEANILVGTQYPILTSNIAGTTTTTTVTSLDYYQDIGIQLRVVPQIAAGNYINMIVHPAVTSFTTTLKAQGSGGVVVAEYPILTTREVETQILMQDGETIVIGGLLKDEKTKSLHKVPFLGDIPLLGKLFQRQTDDIGKIDLLIFITARIATEAQTATQTPVFEPDEPGPKTKIHWHLDQKSPETAAK